MLKDGRRKLATKSDKKSFLQALELSILDCYGKAVITSDDKKLGTVLNLIVNKDTYARATRAHSQCLIAKLNAGPFVLA